ncbi:hypothetical protein LIER_02712 [Lithospermum erythrorhizon]|uniref:Remorin C-terminal domain-containing protein n=1 Tax=Lithospermum erythrorhizon TaxID=34254 RepID=A0AAV3NV31_LITER
MNATSNKYYETPPLFVSQMEAELEKISGISSNGTNNPFLDTFSHDPLCELNLKETSGFVKSFPMDAKGILDISSQRERDSESNSVIKRSIEAPPTPGRPVFSFSTSVGNFSRKAFPSKWDDAEKWLASSGTTLHDNSPSYHHAFKISKQFNVFKHKKDDIYGEKSRGLEEKVSKVAQEALHLDNHCHSYGAFNGGSVSTDVVLFKDKFTKEMEPLYPNSTCSEPMKEGFVFGDPADESMNKATTEVYEVKHRDIGTEMTPIGSATTSRCHTPFKNYSPSRHNTPANRSGPLVLANMNGTNPIDFEQFQECHLAKLGQESQFDIGATNWSMRDEEEEDLSKSLRHCEINDEFRMSVSEPRSCAWEEEEKSKCCLRYQREEAKIQAWVNLQNAKAEAQSRKLEVKIQKMRANMEEKLMKRMAIVHRKAEEWRAEAQLQHSQQTIKVTGQAQKLLSKQNFHFTGKKSCSCSFFHCKK